MGSVREHRGGASDPMAPAGFKPLVFKVSTSDLKCSRLAPVSW